MKISFIGTGIMGLPMAKNLLQAGFGLRVFNRTAAKLEPLVALGAETAASPSEAAIGVDVLISIVSRTEDVQQVLLGEQGAVHGASKGCLFIDMSTIDSVASQSMGAELQEQGIDFIDAPVSGGETGAINASLTIFCGGNESSVEHARPVFQALGKSVNHMGHWGTGQAAKACNQILAAGALMGVAEALAYGKQHGLDLQQLVEATRGGAAQSWQLENLGPMMADNDFRPGFMVDLFHKDLSMILAGAEQQMPIAGLAREKFAALQQAGDGSLGSQAMYKAFVSSQTGSKEQP